MRVTARQQWGRGAALILIGVTLSLGLGACENIKQSLGMTKQPPDEFAVLPNVPLIVPPDFQLRPPGTGGSGEARASVRDKAAADVFGTEPAASSSASASDEVGFGQGEAAILRQAGAVNNQPDIRDTIDREFSIYAREDESFLSDLLFWQEEVPPGEPLDASAEAKRLKENAALGKPANEGEMPVIKRHEEGIF
jgi:hypothetical protein